MLQKLDLIIKSSFKSQAGACNSCHDACIDDYGQIKYSIDAGAITNRVLVEMSIPQMPEATDWRIDSLTTNEKDILQCWIDQGYPEN